MSGAHRYDKGVVSIKKGESVLRCKGASWQSKTLTGRARLTTDGKVVIDGGAEIYGVKSIDGDTQITLSKPFTRQDIVDGSYIYFEGDHAPRDSGAVADTGRTIVYALLIALFIRAFLFQPFNIPSSSMESTLLIGDYLFVSKYAYGYSRHSLPFSPDLFDGRVFAAEPTRGDVVVFKFPIDTKKDYIKRVIGLPGDRIQMIDGVLHINGDPVKKERVSDYVKTDKHGNVRRISKYIETLPNGVEHTTLDEKVDGDWDTTRVYLVPDGHYFMMGDNRDNSTDSRVPPSRHGVGFVPRENLVGRAEIKFFSTDQSARFWQFWRWPQATRFERIFQTIE